MKIAALKERAKGERRAAISPETAKLFTKLGLEVFVEKDIGAYAGFADEDYKLAGAKVSAVPLEICSDADIILKVSPSPLVDQINEVEMSRPGAVIIGLLSPHFSKDYIEKVAQKQLSSLAMELVPRITRAQSMDALSSQANLAGYRAVIEAVYHFNKATPMLMTAAGTITPAKALVLGAGVAGLSAIATAKRLGCAVSAFDVRSAAKEQVESLGAKFVMMDSAGSDAEDKSGYAKALSADQDAKIQEFLGSIAKNYDIIITTAQIPSRNAPLLLRLSAVKQMKRGSVVVDLATATGGNIEGTKLDDVLNIGGVTMIGGANLASKIAADSSKLYAKNIFNLVAHGLSDKKPINFDDEIISAMIVTRDGKQKT